MGGTGQYMNNIASTPSYSTGGIQLSPSSSMLANPVPYQVLPNCTNCVDSYNHYNLTGSQI